VVEVSSQVSGILEEVMVERGDMVEKGQVIARLKSGVEMAAVEQARTRVEFNTRKAARNKDLYRKQLISIHDEDELETELLLAELQLREASEKLELRTIYSPIQGVVVERFISPGEYVGEEAILKIASYDPLYVEVIVPFERFGTIDKGMRVMVMPEQPVGGEYTAKVTIVDRIIHAASGTFGVRLELKNPSHRLPAGLKCMVRFPKK
jgi:RND family efflux transporter MFP subunit